MKIFISLIIMFSLTSCAVKTSVIWHDGKEVIVKSASDAKVTYKKGDNTLEVDNRGRPGFIEQVFGAALMKADTLTEKK